MCHVRSGASTDYGGCHHHPAKASKSESEEEVEEKLVGREGGRIGKGGRIGLLH